MAHCDYNCCACCDCKMNYCGADDAETKKDICQGCVQALNEHGVRVYNHEQFKDWLTTVSIADGTRILKGVGFEMCIYHNEIDKIYKERFCKEQDK